jgi:hypothetical protein
LTGLFGQRLAVFAASASQRLDLRSFLAALELSSSSSWDSLFPLPDDEINAHRIPQRRPSVRFCQHGDARPRRRVGKPQILLPALATAASRQIEIHLAGHFAAFKPILLAQ